MAWQTAAAIAMAGFGVLGLERLAPADAGGAVAVVVPPWQAGGMAFAAAAGLPIIDIRWGGHLVIFDTDGRPGAAAGLGLAAFAAADLAACGSET